jgi:hypothetical protein
MTYLPCFQAPHLASCPRIKANASIGSSEELEYGSPDQALHGLFFHEADAQVISMKEVANLLGMVSAVFRIHRILLQSIAHLVNRIQ